MLKNKSIKIVWYRSSPTKRVLSVWKVCPSDWYLQPERSAVHPAGPREVAYYKEDEKGQILQEGINEWAQVVPGWQRRPLTAPTICRDSVLHLLLDVRLPAYRRSVRAAGDQQARGFLIGGTSGRTP